MTGWIAVLMLAAALVAVHRPFGDYMYRVVSGRDHNVVERGVYRLVGVDANAGQAWGVYARGVLAFSAVSILFLYAFLRLQDRLWLSLGLPAVEDHIAWNTAVSFVTNTNWQAYSGESTMGHLVQMAGLAVQNFVSAGVGIAVAVALVRGFAARRAETLGNFWVDLTRITLRILLPLSVVFAVVFMVGGVVQNLSAGVDVTTLTGGVQHITGGPVASQEAIKELGTNGGGFYNANSAHPFENPTAWTNWLQILLMLLIPFSLPRVFGRMVGQNRQGYAIAAVMALLALGSIALTVGFETHGAGTVPQAVGAAMEGKEARFGIPGSATFAAATTLTSTGAVNSFHDSYTALGGMMPMVNMMLGEVAPGGAGSGLYGMLILATITVFVAGLMVGRTPEYLGKRIRVREIQLASLYFLVTPLIVLGGTAAAFATGNDATALNTGPHGLSEVLYAFTSAGNNNGSAFAGITVDTPWWDVALGLAMLLGRFLPLILVLALAGSLAGQHSVPESEGTLPTHRPLFVGMVAGVTVVLVALTFLPALALGPLAEGLS
ncbi:K+-transporting ATPase ATPase A chain [Actinoplanes campanulatus]|uniref:Potassium-transporting ATPase potassium-binding subunit n=1 Tax=Actinoplanes campanulatus TaxID=113559 RepID=A0A7W5FEW7_9ACTN|nr:potassium-transporting ATPase subunit KdpA [Actinoplanes campanulatus]MBB3095846.1 K+-transporting ATPase ATPase A chain [Actinoplanes campanulatus]GGN11973.1 potassium-transporting ATPase potassium-binding subunit [Actinoplanes campanulatus]GID37059.1 potassium-transporting ATPase potassium-binding subunit [Actinoplanes campanulatus]